MPVSFVFYPVLELLQNSAIFSISSELLFIFVSALVHPLNHLGTPPPLAVVMFSGLYRMLNFTEWFAVDKFKVLNLRISKENF
jgi:hypothetical protein